MKTLLAIICLTLLGFIPGKSAQDTFVFQNETGRTQAVYYIGVNYDGLPVTSPSLLATVPVGVTVMTNIPDGYTLTRWWFYWDDTRAKKTLPHGPYIAGISKGDTTVIVRMFSERRFVPVYGLCRNPDGTTTRKIVFFKEVK